jgi:hypothetical protein
VSCPPDQDACFQAQCLCFLWVCEHCGSHLLINTNCKHHGFICECMCCTSVAGALPEQSQVLLCEASGDCFLWQQYTVSMVVWYGVVCLTHTKTCSRLCAVVPPFKRHCCATFSFSFFLFLFPANVPGQK